MAIYHFSTKLLSRSSRNTVRAVAYRAGCELYDQQTGQTFDYGNKAVQHVELLLPKEAPSWAIEIQKVMAEDRQKGVQAFVDIVEAAEKRVDARVWREFEFALHRELTEEQNKTLAREFVQDQLSGRGMAAQLNFHFDVDEVTGEEKPHCHVTVTTRRLVEEGLSSKKELEWDQKAMLFELREQWANYSNFHLKLNGHDVQIDHRSNKERGIEMEPQPKRGKGIVEQDKRAQGSLKEKAESPLLDKTQAFHDVQLRNLYRIVRNPEIVFDIVTKHHSTFMWADVQKKLHQYVDEAPLFQRLEDKLKNSNELLLLRTDADSEANAIYATRSMLKAEKSLIESAEELGQSKTHGVDVDHTEKAISKANKELKEHGGLSEDQEKAIHHLVDEGQIKCVVGIAGAGKTTALGVCHEIWKAEGYAVYGLAPTGKAAQNLESKTFGQNGIESTTLHKFLKSFGEGRCQYNERSVLVLDEAGMVDVERFEKLLESVKQLGVKLIVVGDGAQLQPVEAGPAFRLVTTRLGKSELNTVVRQKEEWQRQATVLFGQQKTEEAIQKYAEKDCVHIVDEKLSSGNKPEDVVKRFEISHRVSALIYREMAKEVKEKNPHTTHIYPLVKEHQDFWRYLHWKGVEKRASKSIFQNIEKCRPILEARCLDSMQLALSLVDKRKPNSLQQQETKELLKECQLAHLIGIQKPTGTGVEVRQDAKKALINSCLSSFKEAPEKSSLMLAYSNRDVNDLNQSARSLLKTSGHLSKKEFTYTIKKEVEDDFGRTRIHKEQKAFSKGDRLVFTKNKYWLGVKNGTMGTITELNNQKIYVKLDEGKELSFSANLNPYFDQGWAITIHKSQGTTVDQTFVLASYEMTQNLAYVAMTRHRDYIQVFGSSFDFWRPEKLPEILAKSGEKLSAADYLDADSLNKLMQKDDALITKIFECAANELEAMGAVSRRAFWQVADHFLGVNREKDIRVIQESIREEVRAEALFKKEEDDQHLTNVPHSILPYSLQSQPQLVQENQSLLLGQNVLKAPERLHNEGGLNKQGKRKVTQDEKVSSHSSSVEKTEGSIKSSKKSTKQNFFVNTKEVVENALKENMADFAHHVFSSIGEPHNRVMSSRVERRYGVKGEFSVNLNTGLWINHKNTELSGGPMHLLTKLKKLSFKEAIEYGASWARLSPEQLSLWKQSVFPSHSQNTEKENLEKEVIESKQKIERAKALWDKGLPLQGTIAERYLKEHRKIERSKEWSQDLRYLPNVKVVGEQNAGKSYPCLMVAARPNIGDVTAVQLTFLDPVTAAKADVPVQKRSFGLLKGSAVTVQEDKGSNFLFIAEGVETALSLREAGIEGTIKASLGLANIARIEPQNSKNHIVICGDHDVADSPAAKSLEKSVVALQEKGLKVTIIKPENLGEDFNDVLKKHDPEGVKEILKQAVPQALKQPSVIKDSSHSPSKAEAENVLHEITKTCEKYLYNYMIKESISFTSELKERIPLQAERAANFIFYTHTLNGTEPTEKETKLFLARVKYELDRIPQIKAKLNDEWRKKGHFNEQKAPLLIHMIAERQTSIEGRLFLEAKQAGRKPSSNIPQLAEAEFEAHRAEAKTLAQKLGTQYSLSISAATECARNILRYQETHGAKPTNTQITAMAEIAHKIEEKYPDSLEKDVGSHNLTYLRRMNGDSMFRERCYEYKASISFERDMLKTQEKAALEVQRQRIEQEVSRQKERDFSMSM